MPDRYDPKLSVRPPGDRKTGDSRGGQGSGEDPLVELARLVSGRSTFENTAPKTEKPAATPAASQQPLPSEADLARDLEAELLNELQASFSMLPEIVGRPATQPPAPEPSPPPPPAPTQSKTPPPPPPVPPITFEAPDISALEAELSFRPPTAGPAEAPPSRPPLAPAPARVEPQIRPPQGAARRESLATRIARAAHGGEPAEPVPLRAEPPPAPKAVAPQPPRPNTFKPPSVHGRADSPGPQFRPTLAPNPPPEAPEPQPRQAASRWDPAPEPARPTGLDLTRFAPPNRGNGPEQEELASEVALPTVEEAFFEEEQGDDNFDMVPGYGDEELLPYPEEDLSAYEPRRSRRGPLAIAALLTIAVIGGAAAVMFRSSSGDETPPIITADSSPTKVTPDNTGAGDSEGQAKLIYDRVDPGSEVAGSELVVPGDDPIADIPPIPEDTRGNDVSRVILEGGPGPNAPADNADPSAPPMDLSEGTTVAGSPPPEPEAIGPKKVRTVVVRPDGTIVSSAASPAEETADSAPDLPPPSETPPAPAAEENPLLADDFGVEPIDNPTPEAPAGDAASASVPDVPPPVPTPPTPPPAPPAAAKAPAPPTVVATTGAANGPIDLTPGKPATAPRIPTGSGGGFLIQVSSQRSQEVALSTFRDLQRRYPSILGDREPNIQRADLGERGVYYRVRVGYPTRDEAVRMCENLKSAGGDCILATR